MFFVPEPTGRDDVVKLGGESLVVWIVGFEYGPDAK